jgi:amino acid transporter
MSGTGFVRTLGRRETLLLAFGAMIGWSWVMIAGRWVHDAGPVGAMLAFVLGGAAVLVISLTYAELAAAMPEAGGEHVYSLRALGWAGSFLCTWALVLGYVSVVTFEAVALPTALEYLFPQLRAGYLWTVAGSDVHLSFVLIGVTGGVVMTGLNAAGVRFAAVVQTAVVAVMLVLGAFFFAGAAAFGDTGRLTPPFASEGRGFLGVLVLAPTLFVGFDVIPQAAAEVRLPFRAIGRLLVASVAFAAAWYLLVVLGVALSLDGPALVEPLSTAAASEAVWGGRWAAVALVVAGVGGVLTSWNAFIVGASRALFAMAGSGMLPRALARLHPRTRTPVNAVLLVGGLSVVAPFFGRSLLVWLIDAGSFAVTVAYGFVAASFLALRRREPDMPRPYRAGRSDAAGWVALAAAVAIGALFLPGSPAALVWPYEWAIVGGWAGLGLLLAAAARARR